MVLIILITISFAWIFNWASEASPTLGCSIEVSYIVGMSYVGVCQINCVGGITWPTHMLKVFLGAVKPVTPVLFISYTLEL